MTTLKQVQWRAKSRARWLFSRWPISDLLNRSPRTCWANLVTWALDGGEDALREIGGERCRVESETHMDRSCYCGKFKNGCLARSDR